MRGAEPGRGQRRNFGIAMLLLAVAMLSSAADAQAQSWSVYGGDAAGTRYSPATGITKANVSELRVAWTYHTGDAAGHGAAFTRSSFEVTPILAAGKLVFAHHSTASSPWTRRMGTNSGYSIPSCRPIFIQLK
jgi:hypothetical protein